MVSEELHPCKIQVVVGEGLNDLLGYQLSRSGFQNYLVVGKGAKKGATRNIPTVSSIPWKQSTPGGVVHVLLEETTLKHHGFSSLKPAHVLSGWWEATTKHVIQLSGLFPNTSKPSISFPNFFFPYLSLQRMFFDQQPDSKLSISPLTSIPFRPKTGIAVNTDVTVLPMDSTSKLNHIPKAMGWSNRWIPNEQIPPMTNVQLGQQSSIPSAKPQRYTCHILPIVWC